MFDERLNKISASLAEIQTDGTNTEDRKDIETRRFYVEMLRCKSQARTERPNLDILDDALTKARNCFVEIDGDDRPAYEAALLFYESFASKHKNEHLNVTQEKYVKSLEMFDKRPIPAVCLLRLPDEIAAEFAAYTRKPRLLPNKEIEALKTQERKKYVRFLRWTKGISIVAAAGWLLGRQYAPEAVQQFWVLVLAVFSLFMGLLVIRSTRNVEESLDKLVDPLTIASGKMWYHILFTLAIVAGSEQAFQSVTELPRMEHFQHKDVTPIRPAS